MSQKIVFEHRGVSWSGHETPFAKNIGVANIPFLGNIRIGNGF
jgi:hypothetical protein